MYVIQLNQQSWFKGIWRGWLTTCDSPSEALVYRTRFEAEGAVDYYSHTVPRTNFQEIAFVALEQKLLTDTFTRNEQNATTTI